MDATNVFFLIIILALLVFIAGLIVGIRLIRPPYW
jgi:hypothetical protein